MRQRKQLPPGDFDHLPDPKKTRGPSADVLRDGHFTEDRGFAQEGNDVDNTIRGGDEYRE